MGRPRRHKNDAAKAKAYRDRKKAALQGQTKGQTALVQRVMADDEKSRS
jgi:hypothetical protein